jgi:hypothetical protein
MSEEKDEPKDASKDSPKSDAKDDTRDELASASMGPGVVEQRFGLAVVKRIDQETKKMHVELKTRGEGIPLAEAVIILEGWIKKVKEELQKPYVQNLKFG